MSHQSSHHFFPEIPVDVETEFADAARDADTNKLWPELLKIMQDVWKNEETRFNNLNNRAIAVVTATGIVTTILGLYAKDVFLSNLIAQQWLVTFGRIVFSVVFSLLIITIGMTVGGVLRPGGRSVFGDNPVVGGPSGVHFRRGTVTKALTVDQVASKEYLEIYTGLVNRNQWKAFWLTWSYYVLFLTIFISVIAIVPILWWATPVTAK